MANKLLTNGLSRAKYDRSIAKNRVTKLQAQLDQALADLAEKDAIVTELEGNVK